MTAGPLVLIADSYADAADSLAWVLEAAGLRVITVYDGRAALETVRTRHPDVAVLELALAGVDGLEVARQLRGAGSGDARPRRPLLVALTGLGMTPFRQRAQEAGFDHFLVKPCDPIELLRHLQQAPPGAAAGTPRRSPPLE